MVLLCLLVRGVFGLKQPISRVQLQKCGSIDIDVAQSAGLLGSTPPASTGTPRYTPNPCSSCPPDKLCLCSVEDAQLVPDDGAYLQPKSCTTDAYLDLTDNYIEGGLDCSVVTLLKIKVV